MHSVKTIKKTTKRVDLLDEKPMNLKPKKDWDKKNEHERACVYAYMLSLLTMEQDWFDLILTLWFIFCVVAFYNGYVMQVS